MESTEISNSAQAPSVATAANRPSLKIEGQSGDGLRLQLCEDHRLKPKEVNQLYHNKEALYGAGGAAAGALVGGVPGAFLGGVAGYVLGDSKADEIFYENKQEVADCKDRVLHPENWKPFNKQSATP